MVVGELFLGAFLQVLFDRLASRELLKFAYQEGIKKKLENWAATLSMIQAVLVDAEEKQLTDKAVKQWLEDLRDVAYDVEDMLDEFATEVLRRRLIEESQARTSKVWSLVSSLSPRAVKFSISMGSKIKEITRQLQEISKRRDQFGLARNAKDMPGRVWQRPPSTCLLSEPEVYGRDEDKRAILELLLRDDHANANFSVLPIVGMGGVGKTTLARFVYNDKSVELFNPKAWVCVSDEFDVVRVTRAILESITLRPCDLKDLNQIQLKLKNALASKKFLIVLDDVWNKNYGLWEALKSPFMAGAPGSRIIVTTRDVDVALQVGSMEPYALKLLKEDDCWSVFARHAFENSEISMCQNLGVIRKKVIEKCRGLPLAARTLGGLLRTKQRDDEWEEILDSQIWNLSDEESDVLPVLKLSYYHLPSHLKRCFAFCAILPTDYEFEEKELVLLWMAEGLIQPSEEKKQIEDIGSDYFRDMVLRSLFQPSSSSRSRFIMHDLINDLAQWVAGQTCIRLDDDLVDSRDLKISKKLRHLAFFPGDYDSFKKFETFDKAQCLRTFLPISCEVDGCLTNKVPADLLPKLKSLRVLSLNGYNITKLPDSIGDLKLLRYLNLSSTMIRSLPRSISFLYNLQTLLLKRCIYLKKLPSEMENLINLRHLDITDSDSIEEMPLGLDKLENLITLSDFVVGNNSGLRITVLMNLKFLRGKLGISSLENVTNPQDAGRASLNYKQDIDVLHLRWGSEFDDSRNEVVERGVLDMLKPSKKLKELTIRYYGGIEFPNWVASPSFTCMEIIRLVNCMCCTSLPPLGVLPSLKQLVVSGMSRVKSVGVEFYGEGCTKPFPSLESLHFEEMQEWENWLPAGHDQEIEGFLCLREFSVKSCPKLLGMLPCQLPSLEKLVIRKCEQLVVHTHGLPSLCNLEIDECNEVLCTGLVGSSFLKSVSISNISKLTCLTEVFALTRLEELTVVGCRDLASLWQNEGQVVHHATSLRQLVIEDCPKLVSFAAAEQVQVQPQNGLFDQLESLEIRDCKSLEKLPQCLNSLNSLRELTIEDCPSLVFFLDTGFPSMLREVLIKNCNSLALLPSAVPHNWMCLTGLRIYGCDSLVSFGRDQLPPTLKRLDIYDCKNLQYLLDEEEDPQSSSPSCSSSIIYQEGVNKKISFNNRSSLESLYVDKCPSLLSLASRGELPATLKHLLVSRCSRFTSLTLENNLPKGLKFLEIRSCENLESIVESFHVIMSLERIIIWCCKALRSLPEGLCNLSNLHEIKIFGCRSLVSFPEGGLPTNNLRELSINYCKELRALPNGLQNLTCLQSLEISNCPGIMSFPEEGFPTSLKSLDIVYLKICKPLLEWGLHRITSLRELSISGGCQDVVSFPLEEIGMRLPSSLTSLAINDFPNLEYLSSNGFKNLTSLEFLSIYDCPKVKSLQKSPLLSLQKLHIGKCPLLKQRCKKDRGPEWFKIAHIPYVQIDNQFIYDQHEEEED